MFVLISLTLAEKLKNTGLRWEQKPLDQFYRPILGGGHIVSYRLLHLFDAIDSNTIEIPKEATWLPRLDQLLAEIEQRGYSYNVYDNYPISEYRIRLYDRETDRYHDRIWKAGTPQDAAAKALLWILEEEKENCVID